MKDVMGIISLNENSDVLNNITNHRPLASVPFGGRYRIIDFVLSNMVNSGIQNVGVLTRYKHRSLIDHLRSGKDWDLDRKRDGLFIFPPENINNPAELYNGVMQNLYNNIDYIYKSRQKYVLVSGSDIIYNLNYRQVFDFHKQMKADITMIYKEINNINKLHSCSFITKMKNTRILDMEVNSCCSKSSKMCLEAYIMDKSLLIDIVNSCVSRGYIDFIKDGIVKNISILNVIGYQHTGYVAKINSIESYYQHSMDLLKTDIWKELFFKPGLVYTKVKDGAATKYTKDSVVRNSLIANGCIIEGTVKNSILFRGVRVDRGACIKNSIVMQKSVIEKNAVLENVITDKEVCITAGKILRGDKNYPLVIEKKKVI
ncbi:MAG: glucose-1-phosphate adenylyltransferase subunit GlgD [Desulfotomaculum sp.]|nr:glucose-1-phosphate adenylyltransferase subunit GlgD [Desulfotomaculum sp.]